MGRARRRLGTYLLPPTGKWVAMTQTRSPDPGRSVTRTSGLCPGRPTFPRSLNKIVKRQRESLGDSRDDREPRIRALALLDLRQRLSRNLSAEGEFRACHASFDAGSRRTTVTARPRSSRGLIARRGGPWHRRAEESNK